MAKAKEKREMNAHPFLFEDSFQVKNVDDSRFERAGRMDCESIAFTTNNLEIDINHIIYPVQGGDQIYVAITRNVSPADDPRKLNTAYDHDPRLLGRSVMDHFDYVMYGKVYKKEVKKEENMATVWASYGGLLMKPGGSVIVSCETLVLLPLLLPRARRFQKIPEDSETPENGKGVSSRSYFEDQPQPNMDQTQPIPHQQQVMLGGICVFCRCQKRK
ncbi:RPB8 [Symbiodinium natans]|uniref:RPB8 protein n=1 Tax=Symbiodinium natans TaxID=878477 RepID=A0A812JX91_9DINO|nr:RPB8 [Symbiodinium natans]